MQQPVYNLLASPPDPRDFVYSPRITPDQFARSIDLSHLVTRVEDQLNAGACGGNGFTSQCEGLAKGHGVPLHLSRMFSYATAKKIGNRLPQDGVYMRDLYRAAYHYGLLLEEGATVTYPYDISQQYTDPPAWAYEEAAKMKVRRYEAVVSPSNSLLGQYTAAQVVERLKAALNEGFMPTIGMQISSSLTTLSGPWRTHDYQPVGPGWPSLGGHLMMVVGYDSDYILLKALNSHGAHKGDGGYVGLPYSICADYIFESWIVRDFNGWSIPEAPGVVLAGMNRWNLVTRIVPEVHEIGQTVNVWFAAKRAPDGPLYLRHGMNDWRLMQNNEYPPAISNFLLQDNNILDVVDGMDINPYAGMDIYVAYGQTPFDRPPAKIVTLPQF